MLARVQSFLLDGIDAVACEVEADHNDVGFADRPTVVGLPDAAVKESLERVRSAVGNAGYPFPQGKLVINLAPAHVRKEGPLYDLPIAVGLLACQQVVRANPASRANPMSRDSAAVGPRDRQGHHGDGAGGLGPAEPGGRGAGFGVDDDPGGPLDYRSAIFAGELALDGRIRPVRGVIAMAAMAVARGYPAVVVPAENAGEAAVVPGLEVYGVRTLDEVVGLLTGELFVEPHPPADIDTLLREAQAPVDFAEVRGQESVKRAITIAAAGGHNLLMLGPAGSGKTMMAKALPGVLPPLTAEEAIEVTRIWSASGVLPPGEGLVTTRPVRTPHHTASAASVVGGGMVPRAGEISLAHHGILFLDEMAEFPRDVLETLRQPLEDHVVTISRAKATVRFPASFMLVGAMNPTPKGSGSYADGLAGDWASRREMDRYLSRLSGPVLDRIDLHVEAPAVPWEQLRGRPTGTSSAQIREQVAHARERQRRRQGVGLGRDSGREAAAEAEADRWPRAGAGGGSGVGSVDGPAADGPRAAAGAGRGSEGRLPVVNARLSGTRLDELAIMTPEAEGILGGAMTELGLSARAYDKIRRVALTIADLESADTIDAVHVAEAISYRLLDRRV